MSLLKKAQQIFIFDFADNSSQKGQVLLIVILTMVVALTVGLSVVSRSLTNLRTSKQSEESQRAFQAAEAGIEQALKQIKAGGANVSTNTDLANLITNNSGDDLGNNSAYELGVDPASGNQVLINNGNVIDQNVGFDVWLSDYPDYTNQYGAASPQDIDLYFGSFIDGSNNQFANNTNCSTAAEKANITPAMEILILYGNKDNPEFRKLVIDPCNPVNSRTTGSSGASQTYSGGVTLAGFNGKKFSNRIRITISQGLIMKIIPFYNSTVAGVEFRGSATGPDYPEQGVLISSKGTSGEVVRQLEYFLAYPQIPNELFPYSIVSQ